MMKSHLDVKQIDCVNAEYISSMVKDALHEDVQAGDITASLIPLERVFTVQVITREDMVLSGSSWVQEVFKQSDNSIDAEWKHIDGDFIKAGSVLFKATGPARAILSAERTALNFLQMLSGTATYTARLVKLISHTHCRLLDTRKTIPGFRLAQKYAVYCGGGQNHRTGLSDAFLIKENHINAVGSISKAVSKAKSILPNRLVEVEVESLSELKEALMAKADVIMLDNFSNNDKVAAVKYTNGRAMLEASGNVNEATIAGIAETGVDYISVGSLTKDIIAIDLSMRFI
jgi:nicotinate-nucleotide pyrophosphorylase (carboxylating)